MFGWNEKYKIPPVVPVMSHDYSSALNLASHVIPKNVSSHGKRKIPLCLILALI